MASAASAFSLAGSGFAESVVQSDVNVAAHDVIILQFVSRTNPRLSLF